MTAILLALWQALGSWTGGIAITPPLGTLAYLANLLLTAMFWDHAGATATAFALAFALSGGIGLGLGLILGLQRFAGDVAEPILAGFYTIPKVTLYPVVLLIFGLGMSAKVAFGVMHGLVPVTLFTLGAVRTLPPVLVRAARACGFRRGGRCCWVLMPGLPAGNRERAADRLFAQPARGADRRDVLFAARSRLSVSERPRAAQRAADRPSVVVVIVVAAIVANTLMLRLGRNITHRG